MTPKPVWTLSRDTYSEFSEDARPSGAAGLLVIILIRDYYAAQILLFGAEMIRVGAKRFGSTGDLPRAGPEDEGEGLSIRGRAAAGTER